MTSAEVVINRPELYFCLPLLFNCRRCHSIHKCCYACMFARCLFGSGPFSLKISIVMPGSSRISLLANKELRLWKWTEKTVFSYLGGPYNAKGPGQECANVHICVIYIYTHNMYIYIYTYLNIMCVYIYMYDVLLCIKFSL